MQSKSLTKITFQGLHTKNFGYLDKFCLQTSTLWNTIDGFEGMKDEISSSLKASDIFGLIFY